MRHDGFLGRPQVCLSGGNHLMSALCKITENLCSSLTTTAMAPIRTQLKPYTCGSCNSSFKHNGDLLLHQAQAHQCQWVLKKHEVIEPADQPDFRDLSDLEDDPPAEMDALEQLLDDDEDLYLDDDDIVILQDIQMSHVDHTGATPPPDDRGTRVEEVTDEEDVV